VTLASTTLSILANVVSASSVGKVDVEEIKEKVKTEMEQQNKQLQIMVNSLVTENMDLKSRIAKTERQFSQLEQRFSNMERTVQETRKTLD
jgi:predicted RNase H-like nuclease (RuvC/YqgF family)